MFILIIFVKYYELQLKGSKSKNFNRIALGTERTIILQCTLEKQGVTVWPAFGWFRKGSMDMCVNSLGTVKGGKHLKHQLSKKALSWSWQLSFANTAQ